MKITKLKSPGKINLRLDIVGRRRDGMHELRMVNSLVSLYDDIDIEFIDKGVEIECDDPLVPTGEENLVYKAAKEIMAYSNKNVGVKIKIKKNIPVAAGMGGGSSNAATVILGLNDILRINLPQEKLDKIGLRFGSDIPFFLHESAAIATGVGENIEEIKLPKLALVIVAPNKPISTKSVYDKYARGLNGSKKKLEELPDKFATKKTVVKYTHNDLESVTVEEVPEVEDIKSLLKKNGAMGSQMTGSGPTVFGIFSTKDKAEKAVNQLESTAKENEWRVFLAESL
jgi:4-diphosphocytidyl-2-C-methyl-D-erythritol kinase